MKGWKMNENLKAFILRCSDKYYAENLQKYDREKILNNWWDSFDFFLEHACYQGRRDEISYRVYLAAKKMLSPLFANDNKGEKLEQYKQQKWGPIRSQLGEVIGKGKVGKGRDLEMILSALEKVSSCIPERNFVAYSIDRIKRGEARKHYLDLQHQVPNAELGIVQVGPKIAALYLRDVVSLFQVEAFVDNDALFCLQPIDTWVRQLAVRLGIVSNENEGEATIQNRIVEECSHSGISSFRFNQGLWYLGFNSLKLLLEAAENTSLRG